MLEQIKARIAEIEKAMSDLVAQHNVLSGHLNEAKHLLDLASKLAGELAPHNPVVEDMQAVDKAVDEVSDVVAHIEDAALSHA